MVMLGAILCVYMCGCWLGAARFAKKSAKEEEGARNKVTDGIATTPQ